MAQYNLNNRQGGSYVQYTRSGSAMRESGRKKLSSSHQKYRQEDLFNSGMPDESPFKTMYQATIGTPHRTATAVGNSRRASQTPQHNNMLQTPQQKGGKFSKSMQKLEAFNATSNRKFGQYEGPEGPKESIWGGSPCKSIDSAVNFYFT